MKHRDFIFKCFTLLFLAAYSLSLAGIDVHHCSHTGKTYVTFLADSISCENIHPSHDGCGSNCGCGDFAEEHSNKDGGCCHDEPLQHLSRTDGNSSAPRHIQAPISDIPVILADELCLTPRSESLMASETHYIQPQAPDPLDLFCVLRI